MNADSAQMEEDKKEDFKFVELTEKIIGCFYSVYNQLGYGFLEKVYEKALIVELEDQGIKVESQVPLNVFYKNKMVGEYFADIIVEQKVIIEIKAVENLNKEHEAQLLNYLKATDLEVGLLLNFGPKAQIKRKVYDNDKK